MCAPARRHSPPAQPPQPVTRLNTPSCGRDVWVPSGTGSEQSPALGSSPAPALPAPARPRPVPSHPVHTRPPPAARLVSHQGTVQPSIHCPRSRPRASIYGPPHSPRIAPPRLAPARPQAAHRLVRRHRRPPAPASRPPPPFSQPRRHPLPARCRRSLPAWPSPSPRRPATRPTPSALLQTCPSLSTTIPSSSKVGRPALRRSVPRPGTQVADAELQMAGPVLLRKAGRAGLARQVRPPLPPSPFPLPQGLTSSPVCIA